MKNSQEELKPIHKFNNGMGATLCNECYVIISEGLTEELFCEKCKPKQETLEEVAENYSRITLNKNGLMSDKQVNGFIAGAKYQAERMYSEEDMLKFAEFIARYPDKNRNYTGQMLHAKSKYDGAERTIDLLQVWFEQFKKKA
jgi:hypothetical protein